jgi:ketosteroid isomerase-like protein
MSRNLATLQAIYQAFATGDVPAILERLAPGVAWESWEAGNSAQQAGYPLFTARQGREATAGFFAAVGSHLEMHDFQVLGFLGDGAQIAAEVVIEFSYRPTGQRVRDEEIHLWTFDGDGQVARFRHYIDTAKHLRAAGLLAP